MPLRPGLCLLFLLLALAIGLPGALPAAELGFQGGASYQVDGSKVHLRIAQVFNGRKAGSSGTLRFDLWATTHPYQGGSIQGYTLGSFTKEGLDAGYSYIRLFRTLEGRRPPAGSYAVTLTVSEYQNGAYRVVDHLNFDNRAHFYPQQPAGKPLALQGATSYRTDGGQLRMRCAEIINRRPGGYSGTLLLSVWATRTPYRGGSLSGYQLGARNLGHLNGGHSFRNLDHQVPLVQPPDGSYHITLVLSEYRGDEYVIADYVAYSGLARFTAPKKPLEKPIRFKGTGGFALDGDRVEIRCDQITNLHPSGHSGTLKLRLMATSQPYRGENISGWTLGSLRRESLKGGFSYSAIRESVPLTRPPAGTYHASLILYEYADNQFRVIDYIAFPDPLTFAPAKPLEPPLRFVGTGGYSYKDDRVTLTCDQIVHEARGGTSGTLKVQLWATAEPYRGGDIQGFLLGGITRDGLKAGNVYKDLEEQTAFTRPPDGSYHLSLLLMEYDGEEYVIKDHIAFKEKKEFTTPAPPSKPLRFVGYSSYKRTDDIITIKCDKITNSHPEGTSGPLRLRLWATETPYKGGDIDGYVLATLDKDPLKAGYSYESIDEDLPYKKPPEGRFTRTLTLSELRDGKYVIVDYITFD